MSTGRHCIGSLLVITAMALPCSALALELPPSCGPGSSHAPTAALKELRKQLEKVAEVDPDAAVRLMCDTIPRVAREKGEHSVELAWWAASLATPLIAYMNKFNEAIPLLEFAGPILEKHLDHYAPEAADIHVAYAWIYFRQGRLADAGNAWQAALRIRERAPGDKQVELQKVLVGLAQVRLSQRDFAASHAALDRATAIMAVNHAEVSEAGAAIENAQTNLAFREEDYRNARLHAEAQIRIEQQLGGGAPQLVPAYVLLGTALERLDEFDASEAALREAIRLAESQHGPLQRHYQTALNEIASLLNERDRPQEALPFARRALELGDSTLGPDAPKLVGTLTTLADVERASGNLPQALHLYQRAALILQRNRADIERQVLVAHYRGLADLELELGDLCAARTALASALDAAGDDASLATERGFALLALSRSAESRDPKRRVQLDEALLLLQSRLPASHPIILRVINELCGLEIAAGSVMTPRCDEASQWLAHASDVEPSLRSAVYRSESLLAAQRGDLSRAYAQAIEALAAAESIAVPEPLWRSYFNLASTLHQREDQTLAVFFGKQAVRQIEQLRGDFTPSDLQLERSFLKDKAPVYRSVADWLMESGRIDEGLEVLGLLKGEELYDMQLRDANARSAAEQIGFTPPEQLLREQYSRALQTTDSAGAEIDRLSRLLESDNLSAAEQAHLRALLSAQAGSDAARLVRIEAFLNSGASARPPAAKAGYAIRTRRLASELQSFGADTAMAVFLLTHDRLRILVATRLEQQQYDVPLDAAALQREIGEFLASMARRDDISASSRSLYDTVAKPVDLAAQRAHAKRLVLWMDGALRYLPFAALDDGKHLLVEKYALQSYSVNDAQGMRSGRTRAAKPLYVRGLGVTQAVAGFDALPALADELCDVVRGPIAGLTQHGSDCISLTVGNGALPGTGFADSAFTEARFRSVLLDTRDFSVLHIGTHFSLRPGNSLRSFLVLGDGSHLKLSDISQLSFSGIDLVTLSACQTGLGGAIGDDGSEIEGLSAIVQHRGARQVIASLWQVEDKSTASLMRQLYESLVVWHGDGARALQLAQLALRGSLVDGRRVYAHPFYWAGFIASAR
jgi:CHAT domain-containing protein/tetratricopeptide (TPR) repeat protein